MNKPTPHARKATKKSSAKSRTQAAAKQPSENPRNAVAPARDAAFRILLAVEDGKSHSDDLLRTRMVNRLAPADRNLATALVLGVLRWQMLLDAKLQAFLKRPNAKLDAEVRIALRLGAFQLLQMDRIPARAAIDESVELTKLAGHRFASGMVNAVLRKFATALEEGREADALAAHPAWLVERWTRFYGADAVQSLCAHGQSPARIAIRRLAAEAELEADGVALQPGELLTCAAGVVSGDIAATAAFREQRVRIQDEGSQLVAELAAASLSTSPAQKHKKILDACSAPGGKTLVLAERHPQASIVACEISESRCEELRRRMDVPGTRVQVRCADASQLPDAEKYDLVLADVPCSGTGTLGRNPEIRHRLTPDDLPRQAERQRAILRAAFTALQPGGRLIYSTCSLEPEENEDVVHAVLAAEPGARLLSLADTLRSLRSAEILTAAGEAQLHSALTPEGCLRLLPGTLPTDGFFVALIERAESAV